MSKGKILVIDDHPIMHRELEKMLTTNGYEFFGAFDVVGGLRKAKLQKPDLVLVDIMLPEIEGTQVVRSFKTDPDLKNVPIIFMTVTLSKKDEAKNKMIKVDSESYPAFAKPISYPKLFLVFEQLIKK